MIDPDQFADAWEPHRWRARTLRWGAVLVVVALMVTLIAWWT